MPETIEAYPAPEVMPGDWIEVQGSGFIDISFEPVEPEIDPDTGEPLPQHSCAGIVIEPRDPVVISIAGIPVANVTGPDFVTEVQVPIDLPPGQTSLTAGLASVTLFVDTFEPKPCPAAADVPLPRHCEPCPVYVQGAAVSQIVPEYCPDACGVVGGDAVWCPPPPCEVYLQGAPEGQIVPGECPPPCGPDGVWCPPEPCPLDAADVLPEFCEPCPLDAADVLPEFCEPCPVFVQGAAVTQVVPEYCPEPCGPDGVWCPPPPCEVYLHDAPQRPAIADECPEPPCGPYVDEDYWCPPEPAIEAETKTETESVLTIESVPAAEPEVVPPAPTTSQQDRPTRDDRVVRPLIFDEPTLRSDLVARLHERSVETVRELLSVASFGLFG